MEFLIDTIANNTISDLQTGILDAKFEITQKNKVELVRKAAECGHVECLKILIQNGYPVINGWDSPVKPAAAKGTVIRSVINRKAIQYSSDTPLPVPYILKLKLCRMQS